MFVCAYVLTVAGRGGLYFTWLGRVVELPVDTVGPGVGLDHGSDKSEGSRGNDGGTEKHCESF